MKKIITLLFFCVCCLSVEAHAAGNVPFATVRVLYSGSNVTTGAWTQISPGFGITINKISIFDSSGQTLKLGVGSIGNETDMHVNVFPGGNGDVTVNITPSTPISIKALSGTASSGELDVNFFI